MIFHQTRNSRSNFNYNARYYTDANFAPHFHKNYELIFVICGRLSLVVNGCGQTVSEGNMALILSNQIHSFSGDKDTKIWVAVFGEEFVPQFASEIKGKQGKKSVFQPDEEVRCLISEKMMDRECSLLMKKACFYAVCDEYLNCTELETRRGNDDLLAGKMLDWIANHYTEDISLKGAADVFGYEYHYLSRLLNHGYGINFKQMVNSYRIEAAIELLQEGELSIAEIALQSGFQSIRSFNHIFKLYTGYTPGEYPARRSR